MNQKRWLILTALSLEAQAIARSLKIPKPRPGKPACYRSGPIHIEVHLIGIGAIRMPDLSDSRPVDGLIMAGVAGALSPILQVGDVVIDDCPPAYLPSVSYHAGKIIVASAIVATSRDKQNLFEQTRALAVDMESEAARDFAKQYSIPFISIRAISDTAQESLNPIVLKLVDAFGRPRPLTLAVALLRRPSLIPQLRQLAAHSKLAASNLARGVIAMIERIGANEP